MNRKQLLVFDWDDTFTLGATEAYMACYRAVTIELGLNISDEEIERRIKEKWGSTQEVELENLIKGFNVDLNEAVRIYESNLFGDTFVDNITLVSGAKEALEKLSGSYDFAIVTGLNGKLLVERILPKFNIAKSYFKKIFSVYDLSDSNKAKPHPFMLIETMKKLGYTPSETIMVGDAPGDIKMALAAKVKAIAVLTGHLKRPQAEEIGAAKILESIKDLPKHLRPV